MNDNARTSIATIGFKTPRPTSGGFPVAEGCDLPKMRPRTGKRGSDRKLAALLCEALDNLKESNCTFWACEGPNRPVGMMMCRKCAAMREIATVYESLKVREIVRG